MALKLSGPALVVLLLGCSANPLDPDRIGCIETAVGSTCSGETAAGGDEDPCTGACNALDQCSAGGLAAQGVSVADCRALCEQGQLAAPNVVACLAQANTCDEANLCVQ